MYTLKTLAWDWTDCVLIYFWVRAEGIVRLHKLAFGIVSLCLWKAHKVLSLLSYSLVENVLFIFLYWLVLVSLAFRLARVRSSSCDCSVLMLFVAWTERNNSVALSQTLSSYFTSTNRKWGHIHSFAFLHLFTVSQIICMRTTWRQSFETFVLLVSSFIDVVWIWLWTNMSWLLFIDLSGIKCLVKSLVISVKSRLCVTSWWVWQSSWAVAAIA